MAGRAGVSPRLRTDASPRPGGGGEGRRCGAAARPQWQRLPQRRRRRFPWSRLRAGPGRAGRRVGRDRTGRVRPGGERGQPARGAGCRPRSTCSPRWADTSSPRRFSSSVRGCSTDPSGSASAAGTSPTAAVSDGAPGARGGGGGDILFPPSLPSGGRRLRPPAAP